MPEEQEMDGPAESSLAGRVALVTGASRGIGAAVARRLAEAGADVVLTARSAGDLEALAAELTGGGVRATAISADMADRTSLRELMDAIGERFDRLDVLVNNAGMLPPAARAEATGWEMWDRALDVNLSAPWYLACRAKELMGDRGVIVNNASTAAYYPSRGLVPYNVSKAGLVMLTRVLALEWARSGIRVVGVAPGKIATDMVEPILRWVERAGVQLNPQGRLGADREVADLIAFLVSDRAAFLTGVTVPLDGGELLTAGSEAGR
jgi:3-oxoacyl-[acyl-carrier protein] reductase